MAGDLPNEALAAARGQPVVSSDGLVVGDVDAIYYDRTSGKPEWVGVGMGFIATSRVLAPAQGARLTERGLELAYAADLIKAAPPVEEDKIDPDTERAVAAHYGIEWREPPPQPAEARDETRAVDDWFADDTSLTRHEEELYVDKTVERAGGVRLRKWAESEPVAFDVELARELVEVVREPANERVDAELREAEVVIPVNAEKAVVHKKTIAKERISVDRQLESRVETVTDELRKERVEVEGDVERPR